MRRIFLSLIAVLMAVGCQAQEVKNHNLEVAKNLEIFNAIYKNLDLMYVDTLDASELIGTGINAMLRSLDPYTEYYPEEKQKDLKLLMTGKYAGIGALVRYHQKLKRVVIEEPYAGMPSAEVGLKKGDIILQIDDTLMTDKTVSYVSEHLRGDAGTTFVLKIERPSTGKKMTFKITRKSIKMPEIPYYGMRPNGVGYINLNTFTGEPSKPMRRAFLDLKKQGAQKLILDLRGNGGGALAECVDIANMWIPKGVTLVETKGKIRRANSQYTTRLEPIDTVMPLVILVNDETASASEIVSGSVQDLDRGIIIGTRTYGKGLVQIPNVEVPYNGNLKLTTSKYFIPSGRCIQAINYKHGGGGYKEHVPDSLTHVFYTKNGREVRDGGGIMPDIVVKPDTLANITLYLDRLDSTETVLDYVVDYIAKHPTIAAPKDFHLTDADYEDFKQRVVKAGFTYDQVSKKQYEELVKVAKFEGYYDEAKSEFEALKAKIDHHDIRRDLDLHRQEIQHMLEQDIISAYYYQAGQLEAALQYDKTLKEAERVLNTPGEYERVLKGEKVK
ncbi:MAG: PDZ domain-containing protein [Prevotella sp.]|jgi:carboxyl-terminal processing protease|nr:PDZ domain-containing protein [Prevotella sp.]MBQ2195410.1 PDZ domain-containing protein [Prevotella sp.]MBQ5406988.1 PDZ domain-containing protein [Prevotella sp.]